MLILQGNLNRSCLSYVITVIGLLGALSSCSRDEAITKDYKLFDLDGSNQVIIGAEGMIKVPDVTAYDLDGTKIIYESGMLGVDGPDSRSTRCRYGYINTDEGLVIPAKPGSGLHHAIRGKLLGSRKGEVSRSCVAKS